LIIAEAAISAWAIGAVGRVCTAVFAALSGQFTCLGYRQMNAASGTLTHLFGRAGSRRGSIIFSYPLAQPFRKKQQPDNYTDQQKKQHFSHERLVDTFPDQAKAALCAH
jgi:hypothetical protein